MLNFFHTNRAFLYPFLAIQLIAMSVLLLFEKAQIHLFINQFHSLFFDIFFKLVTHLGDGLLVILVGIIFLLIRLKYGLMVLTSYAATGIFVQLLKISVFSQIKRPLGFFEDQSLIHWVEGVTVHANQSFPSGHATSAFALFFTLCLISKNNYLKFACFVLAALVAFSRVYLSQHFLIDIVVGSLIGFTGAFFFFNYFNALKSNRFSKPLFEKQ
jgi:membrane-associated phospholipid phosphatase